MMNFELHIRFYNSASKKQNMWMEGEGHEGKRYEIDNVEDAKEAFGEYINDIVKNSASN